MRYAVLVIALALAGCNGKTWKGWQVCEVSASPFYGYTTNYADELQGGFEEVFAGRIVTDGQGQGNDNVATIDFTRSRVGGVASSANSGNHAGGVSLEFKACQAQRMVVIERRAPVVERSEPKTP